jgi:hypothetical protein
MLGRPVDAADRTMPVVRDGNQRLAGLPFRQFIATTFTRLHTPIVLRGGKENCVRERAAMNAAGVSGPKGPNRTTRGKFAKGERSPG